MRHAKSDLESDVGGVKISETINERFATAIYYRNYCLLNVLSRYYNDVKAELPEMANMISVRMKGCTCSQKDPMKNIAFLQTFKLAYKTCKFYKRRVVCHFQDYIIGQ